MSSLHRCASTTSTKCALCELNSRENRETKENELGLMEKKLQSSGELLQGLIIKKK